MPDDPALRIFPDEFVPNVQASDAYKRWAKSSPGDRGRWESFRDALLADPDTAVVPAMSTKFGRALVAAGREHMSITHFVGAPTDPYPPPSPPVSPLTPENPITITTGGTYSGHYWRSTFGTGDDQASCAVVIQTAQPVTIENSIIENTVGGRLLQSAATGSQVTIRNCRFKGITGGTGRAIAGQGWRSWVVENCTIEHTGGIYFQNYGATYGGIATVLVRYNRHLEVAGGTTVGTLRQFCQFNTILDPASIIVEWNEVLNTYGTSVIEDGISVFGGTSKVIIRNNFLRGGYHSDYQSRTSGTGIVIGDFGGSNNIAHDNQIVAFDAGIGISGGANNHVYNNRLVTDGRFDGVTATIPNQGLICYTTTPGNDNTLYDNYVGYCQSDAYPSWSNSLHRTLGYTPTADNDVAADNQLAYGNLTTPMTQADEDAEWTFWQNKLAANGITLGAS